MPSTVNPLPWRGVVRVGQAQLARHRGPPAAGGRRTGGAPPPRASVSTPVTRSQRPDAADVGDGGRERHDPLGLAQRGGDVRARRDWRDRRDPGERRLRHGVRSAVHDREEAPRLRGSRDRTDRGCCRRGRRAARRRRARRQAPARQGRAPRIAPRAARPRPDHKVAARPAAAGTRRRSCGGRLAVRRLPGQAARGLVVMLHRLATLALLLDSGGRRRGRWAAWRLSQGPLELPWLAHRIEDAVNGDNGPTRLQIGTAALAWEGFRRGSTGRSTSGLTDVTASRSPRGAPILTCRARKSRSRSARCCSAASGLARSRWTARACGCFAAPMDRSPVDLGSLTERSRYAESRPKSGDAAAPERSSFDRACCGTRTIRRSGPKRAPRLALRPTPARAHPRCRSSSWSTGSSARHGGLPRATSTCRAQTRAASRERRTRSSRWAISRPALLGLSRAGRGRRRLACAHSRRAPCDPAALARAAPGLAALRRWTRPSAATPRSSSGRSSPSGRSGSTRRSGPGQAHVGATTVPLVGAALIAERHADSVTLQMLRIDAAGT